jgi:hypothetical protein
MKTEAVPRVGVIDALATGLTEAVRRPLLITIPLITELLLWLAPPLSISGLLQRVMTVWEALLRATYAQGQMTGLNDMITSMRELMAQAGSSFNLLDGISGGWLGVPSALSTTQVTRMTFISDLVLAPAGLTIPLPRMAAAPWQAAPIEVGNIWLLLLLTAGFWMVGQVLVAAYLRWCATSWRSSPPVPLPVPGAARPRVKRPSQAGLPLPGRTAPTVAPGVRPALPVVRTPWVGLRGLLNLALRLAIYSIVIGVIVMVLRMPLAFALGLLWISNSSLLGVLMLLFGGVALWLTLWFLVSLFFVTEAIVLDEQTVMRGLVRSIVLVHNNFWPTMGLGVLINLLMYGFRAVWGLLGHDAIGCAVAIVTNAYLSTGMLLAIFAFYESLSRRPVTRRVVGSKT